jgi:probable phosphoglycerate mutase
MKMEEKMKCTLCLVRHGQTDWNAEDRIQGLIDRSLTDTGRRQAHDLIEGLRALHPVKIYTSPLLRAKQTAEIIANALDCPLEIEPTIHEASYGSSEGITKSEFASRFQVALNKEKELSFNEQLFFKVIPDGESCSDILARVIPALLRIAKNHLGEKVIVVSHGYVMRALLGYLQRIYNREIIVPNAGISILESNGTSLKVSEERQKAEVRMQK